VASSPRKVIVLLSGGAESTAVLYHAVKLGVEVEAVHFEFSNASAQETQVCKDICERLNVPLRIPVFNFNNSKDDKPMRVMDIMQWLPLSAIVATRLQPDEVWYGINRDERLDVVGQIEVIFDVLQNIRKKFKTKDIKIDAPLRHLTKREHYDMIDVDIQSKLVYCWEDKLNPCGECDKCKQWKIFVRDAEPKGT